MRESKVDWEQQWSLFAENFYDGKAHIDLSKFGGDSELLLLPGPGFGDLSHPTTYLMLEFMQQYVAGENILDIGCGSGILSLAALKLGSLSAYGIDIDSEAIEHAKKNNELNHLKAQFSERLPAKGEYVLLMNMILPEQKQVMAEKDRLNKLARCWITSGILATQQAEYLALTRSWGWRLSAIKQRGEWLAACFNDVYN